MQLTQSGLVNSSFSFLFIWLICVSVYTNFILLLFIFTRDTMHKCGLCCGPVSICTSVHPSVTLVDCINMAEDIIKLLSRPGSPITLVFWPWAPVSNSKGNSLSSAQNTRCDDSTTWILFDCLIVHLTNWMAPWKNRIYSTTANWENRSQSLRTVIWELLGTLALFLH